MISRFFLVLAALSPSVGAAPADEGTWSSSIEASAIKVIHAAGDTRYSSIILGHPESIEPITCPAQLDSPAAGDPDFAPAQEGFVDNNGTKIHYVSLGQGPLAVMIHGFPDFWYTWNHQMKALSKNHQVVAIDLRGYNRSDKPDAPGSYAMPVLLTDVHAVIRHFGQSKAILIAHDWGAFLAWSFALTQPFSGMVDKLVVLTIPHPLAGNRALYRNPDQRRASAYAAEFAQPGFSQKLSVSGTWAWMKNNWLARSETSEHAKPNYVAALCRSSFKSMMAYYAENYPKAPPADTPAVPEEKKLKVPTLVIIGDKDPRTLAQAHDYNTDFVSEANLTTIHYPQAGHFVHHDAAEGVTADIERWLAK